MVNVQAVPFIPTGMKSSSISIPNDLCLSLGLPQTEIPYYPHSLGYGEFKILEVDCWTLTPISANIGTFAVPLLTYILIETNIKGVPRTSSDKYDVRGLGYT